MKKKYIILLLMVACTGTAMILQYIEMNLTIRTILVTRLMAFLFSIRMVLTIHDDKA